MVILEIVYCAMKTLLLLVVLCSFSSLKAQDTIFYRNNTHELARIIKVDRTTISYKNYADTLDNSVYYKSNITVSHVVLSNGERHNLVSTKTPSETIPELPDLYPAFLSFNVFDLITSQLTFNFQYSFKNHKHLTIGVPLSVSFNTLAGTLGDDYYGTSNYYFRNKVFSTGMELMFFPISGVNDGYMIGTALDFGLSRFNIPIATDVTVSKDAEFYGLYLRTGYFLNKIKHFGLAFYGDVGVSRRSRYDYYYYYDPYYPYPNNQFEKYYHTTIAYKLSIQVGYTF